MAGISKTAAVKTEAERIREMVELVRPEVTAPGINQGRGSWNDNGDCCAGSRIAHALGVPSGMYLDGIDEWAKRMGLTRAHVIAMLQDAGAGHDPIGPERWPEPPAAIWRRLREMENRPQLAGRNLSGLNLAGTDLRELDLSGCGLDAANLRNARLEETDLSFSRMREAVLAGANLKKANLAGADLTRADLTRADMRQANLRGTRTERAKLAGARLEGTRMERAKLAAARLEGTRTERERRRRRD